MPLDKEDLKNIKGVVVEAVEPHFVAIQKDFDNIENNFKQVYERFDRI